MSDIDRSANELVHDDPYLNKQRLQVLLAEKLNQLKKLDVHLDHIKTVEIAKVELATATLTKEILLLRTEISRADAIPVKPSK